MVGWSAEFGGGSASEAEKNSRSVSAPSHTKTKPLEIARPIPIPTQPTFFPPLSLLLQTLDSFEDLPVAEGARRRQGDVDVGMGRGGEREEGEEEERKVILGELRRWKGWRIE